MLESLLNFGRKIIPKSIFNFFQPAYHWVLALVGAILYRFPGKKTFIILVTGTKGKTSTAEIVNAFLEEAGYKTALSGTLRIKVGEDSKPNMFKMTVQGRFFVQSFLRRAVNAKCDYVILEMTSQAVLQYRHKFLYPNAIIFTNLSPEHVESHGSYENYGLAKLEIGKSVEKSSKTQRISVANEDDEWGKKFLTLNVPQKLGYSFKEIEPVNLREDGIEITLNGVRVFSHLRGVFNAYNILGAIKFVRTQGVTDEQIASALAKLTSIKGRVEKVELSESDQALLQVKQNFEVIVDYAHTIDSLTKLYEAFPNRKKICVLGNTGGGRDRWKRPGMAKIANDFCEVVILTDEDPYDEDPRKIVDEMAVAIDPSKLEIIMDRREAISAAIKKAKQGDVVLISGKGTDPYIMMANHKKLLWSDSKVAEEELKKVLSGKD